MARMSDDERRHLDTLAIGIMTLATVIVAGMFGLLGFATWDNEGSDQLIEWVIAASGAGAAVAYFVCVTTGVDVLNDVSPDKLQKFRALTNGFLFTAGTVVIVAALVIISRLN